MLPRDLAALFLECDEIGAKGMLHSKIWADLVSLLIVC